MPGLNGTGPLGQGPRTGWGLGLCGSGASRTTVAARPFAFGWGRGFGFGRGRGRRFGRGMGWRFGGWGWRWAAPYWNAVDDREYLNARAKWLQDELSAIEKRLSELEASSTE